MTLSPGSNCTQFRQNKLQNGPLKLHPPSSHDRELKASRKNTPTIGNNDDGDDDDDDDDEDDHKSW